MALVPEWRRRAVGAAGVGVAAPTAVVAAAIAVGFGGGGVRGLDNLGQAVTGPVIPDARGVSAGGTRQGEPRADLLADTRPARRRTPRPPAAGSTRAPVVQRVAPPADTGGGSSGGGSSDRGSTDSSGGGSSPSKPRAPAPTATQPATTPPPTTAAPAPTRGPLGNATQPVEDIVAQVPVVGPTAAQVVGGLVDAADGLLTPPAAP